MNTLKKTLSVMIPVCSSLLLVSCEAHFGGTKYDVPWYVVTIPTVVIILVSMFIAGKVIAENTYVCPKCGHRFRPKWWKAMFSTHFGSDRIFKCPQCGKRSLMRKE